EEAQDEKVPLLERLMFESIYASNLDEFFMVRVGSLYDASLDDDDEKDNKTKLRPSEQLSAIFSRVRELGAVRDESFETLTKELKQKGIHHKSVKNLNAAEAEFIEGYYAYEIKPFINANIIDKRHPFPFLVNKSIYVITKLSAKGSKSLGIISCTDKFKRVVFLPNDEGSGISYVLVEDIISHYAQEIFENYKIEEKALMRITRNADIDVDESYDSELDFRQNVSVAISKRKRLCPVRMQLSKQLSEEIKDILCERLDLAKKQVFVEKAPLDLSYVGDIFDKASDKKKMFFEKFEPQRSPFVDANRPMIEQIDEHDLFLSYPYESIDPFIRLLGEAAEDKQVVSIKMTLYRVAKNSKVVRALCKASENGKEVVVLVELRARFDEENNIGWSKALEESGCHVIYGPPKMKVHSKLCLITRNVDGEAKYTVQVGTGNYNEKTAKLYTDFCLMTSNSDIAKDVAEVFRALCIGSLVEDAKTLLVAPKCLQNKVLEFMDNEIALAKAGGDGYVGAKLNSLTDKVIIDKLIECSQAGVKVELVIRGISCLIAGVKDVTDNIHIRSIVGRFLEHSRIYIFGAGVRKQVYISSADYMTRNTTRRVEVGVPILDSQIKQRVLEYFDIQLHDNVKARVMNSDGIYERAVDSSAKCCSQEKFIAMAYEAAPQAVTAQPVQTVQVPEPQPVQTPEPAAEVKQPEPQEKPKPATEPEPQPVQTAEPVQAPEPQQAPAAEPVVQTPPAPQKAAEPPVEQAVQPPHPAAPVQYAQPIDPLPIPQPQPEKKGLWARIKAFFSFKK
ncbi:MAG: polyphosphate kinase 1, partial [Ruminococcus sp.]|nr:polyphosphate kinase 1 [Ruminococcus sp.]